MPLYLKISKNIESAVTTREIGQTLGIYQNSLLFGKA